MLRIIAGRLGDRVVFKGGTSLSKGWGLIQRFSEDVDIFVDPDAFSPRLGSKRVDRELKQLRDAIGTHPDLELDPGASSASKGAARRDVFTFRPRFGATGEVAPRVLVESGIGSGRQPTETRRIESFLAQFLRETETSLGAADEDAFDMQLMHFRRTFVEKLFAIHKGFERWRQGQIPDIRPFVRHYYDLYVLAGTPEVLAMLASDEYREIKEDHDRISRQHFGKHHAPPASLRFAACEALFLPADLAEEIELAYEKQCRLLCHGSYPAWVEVHARFEGLRDLL